MPEKDQTNKTNQEQTDSYIPPLNVGEENAEDKKSDGEKADAKPEIKKEHIKWRRPIIRVDVRPQQPDTAMLRETRRGNTISIAAVIITFLAFVATIITLLYLKASTDAAVAAVNEARVANTHAREKDSLDNIRDTANDRLNREHFDSSFIAQSRALEQTEKALSLQSKLVETQIKSITIAAQSLQLTQKSLIEERKRFELTSRAFFAFDTIKFDTIRPRKPVRLVMRFRNFGKSPALVSLTPIDYCETYNSTILKFRYRNEAKPLNRYITPERPIDVELFLEPGGYGPTDIRDIISGKEAVIIFGEIRYRDIVLERDMRFLYSFQVYWDGKVWFYPIQHNTLIEIKP